MKSIEQIQDEIIEDFNMFDNWIEKYEYLIDLGKEMPQIDKNQKVDSNLIKGCQSRVWLSATKLNGKIIFAADSDAIMTKGIIALLINVLSNQSAHDVSHADLYFIKKIGFCLLIVKSFLIISLEKTFSPFLNPIKKISDFL